MQGGSPLTGEVFNALAAVSGYTLQETRFLPGESQNVAVIERGLGMVANLDMMPEFGYGGQVALDRDHLRDTLETLGFIVYDEPETEVQIL